uniref:VASt domain-containing protein n=1 Tax=Plectus sambesii TaxID=2011161 RepID=A0A914WJL0_9BILA
MLYSVVQHAAANLVVDSFFAAFVLADKRRTIIENSLARIGSISQSGIELRLVSPLDSSRDDDLFSLSAGSPRGNAIDAHYKQQDKHAMMKKVYASKLRRLRMPRVRPASATGTMTNIEWPMAKEFDADIGRSKIIEFIEKTWRYGSPLRYSVEQLYSAQLTTNKRYKYRVCWVWLSDRMTAARTSVINTASIYFNIDVPKFENQAVDVSYTFQSHKRLHRPGRSKFHEKWLDDFVSGRLLVSTA